MNKPLRLRPNFWKNLQLLIPLLLVSQILLMAEQNSQPRLQILNRSLESATIFSLRPDQTRVSKGTIPPGQDQILDPTLGDKFIVIGKESGFELPLTSEALIQGACFDPQAKNGIPAFYSQRKDVSGYPIVASKNVNPYALEEAAYIVRQMLAQRDDLLTAMAKSGARLSIFSYQEFTTDLPEFAHFANAPKERIPGIKNKEFWDCLLYTSPSPRDRG